MRSQRRKQCVMRVAFAQRAWLAPIQGNNQARAFNQGPHEFCDDRLISHTRDFDVKLPRQRKRLPPITRQHGGMFIGDMLTQNRDVVRHRLLRRGLRHLRFYHDPRLEHVMRIARRRASNTGTAVTLNINQLLMRKRLQSTAYDGAGHAVNVA